MLRTLSIAATFTVATTGVASAEQDLVLHIPSGGHMSFHEPVAAAYMAVNPDVHITFRAPSQGYEDAVQTVLRQNITGDLPDITFAGLSKVRLLAERGVAVDLTPFIAAETDWQEMGYSEQIVGLGRVGDVQYAMPYAVSTAITFYNADLVRQAGFDPDAFPETWEGVFEIARAINALGDEVSGLWLGSGGDDWMSQTLVASFGGRMLDETETQVAFADAAGYAAAELLRASVTDAGMLPTMDFRAVGQQFNAGLLGMSFDSTRQVAGRTQEIGVRFDMRTAPFPRAEGSVGGVVAGGAAAVITSRDPDRQALAWDYIKFATGPLGATLVTQGSGYMPMNELAIADKAYLAGWLRDNPNFATSLDQLPIMQPWYAFPGENGVEISTILDEGVAMISRGDFEPREGVDRLAAEVSARLP